MCQDKSASEAAIEADRSSEIDDRQGRLRNSMCETEERALLCGGLGGSYPHSGVRGMREGSQTKRSEG